MISFIAVGGDAWMTGLSGQAYVPSNGWSTTSCAAPGALAQY